MTAQHTYYALLTVPLIALQDVFDPEEVPEGWILTGAVPVVAQSTEAGSSSAAAAVEDEDECILMDGAPPAAVDGGAGGGEGVKRRREADGVDGDGAKKARVEADDDVILL